MFEKVNAGHPDKMADRLAGAVVDLVYERAGGLTKANPRVACEVMAGHGRVDVQIETSLGRLDLRADDLDPLIRRLFGERVEGNVLIAPQDPHLSDNQTRGLRCGDNGIFRGCPPTEEQRVLTAIAATIYGSIPYDGKYIIDSHHPKVRLSDLPEYDIIQKKRERHRNINNELFEIESKHAESMKPFNKKEQKRWDKLIAEAQDINKYIKAKCKEAEELAESQWEHDITICQSHLADDEQSGIVDLIRNGYQLDGDLTINPLGPWTGGIDVDCGCTNRKLGSDMGDGVTGGGLMGKDLSKADVSVNIVCFLKAVASGQVVTAVCSIGDEYVTFTYADGTQETERFADIVEQARLYILTDCGGSFERFAEWGLLRPLAQV